METNSSSESDNDPHEENILIFDAAIERDINAFFTDEGIDDREKFLLGLLSSKEQRGELFDFVSEYVDIFSHIIDKLDLPLAGRDRFEYVYDRFARLFYPEGIKMKFTELDLPLPATSKAITDKITARLKANGLNRTVKNIINKLQNERYVRYGNIIKLRKELFKYVDWNQLSRTTKIQPRFEYVLNEKTGKTDRKDYCYSNNIYELKRDVYKMVKRLSSTVVPTFLIGKSPDLFDAQVGVHFGSFMSCISSFIDSEVCTTIVCDKVRLAQF